MKAVEGIFWIIFLYGVFTVLYGGYLELLRITENGAPPSVALFFISVGTAGMAIAAFLMAWSAKLNQRR